MRAEYDVVAAPGVTDADVEALVGLLVVERLGAFADRAAMQPVAALGGLVLLHVEEGPGVRGPRAGGDARGAVGKELAAREVLHVQRVLAVSRRRDAVCEPARVGA